MSGGMRIIVSGAASLYLRWYFETSEDAIRLGTNQITMHSGHLFAILFALVLRGNGSWNRDFLGV